MVAHYARMVLTRLPDQKKLSFSSTGNCTNAFKMHMIDFIEYHPKLYTIYVPVVLLQLYRATVRSVQSPPAW